MKRDGGGGGGGFSINSHQQQQPQHQWHHHQDTSYEYVDEKTRLFAVEGVERPASSPSTFAFADEMDREEKIKELKTPRRFRSVLYTHTRMDDEEAS